MAPDVDGPKENETARLNRNWQELLQELRVAQTGVQILTGFLLTLPFMPGFEQLSDSRRVVYAGVLCTAIAATFLLLTPVALHRALFRKNARAWLVIIADRHARLGLVALAAANGGALWLILDHVVSTFFASIATGVLGAALVIMWIAIPARTRRNE